VNWGIGDFGMSKMNFILISILIVVNHPILNGVNLLPRAMGSSDAFTELVRKVNECILLGYLDLLEIEI
jgi:hypothetical protein